jgi:hypothetical protein
MKEENFRGDRRWATYLRVGKSIPALVVSLTAACEVLSNNLFYAKRGLSPCDLEILRLNVNQFFRVLCASMRMSKAE